MSTKPQLQIVKHRAGVVVTTSYSSPVNKSYEIAIEVKYPSTGEAREVELINITFPDGSMWTGSFDKLQKALNII